MARVRAGSTWTRNLQVLKTGPIALQGRYIKTFRQCHGEFAANGSLLLFAQDPGDSDTKPFRHLEIDRVLRSERADLIFATTEDDELVVLRGSSAKDTAEWRDVLSDAVATLSQRDEQAVGGMGQEPGIELSSISVNPAAPQPATTSDVDGDLDEMARRMFDGLDAMPTAQAPRFRLDVFLLQFAYHLYPVGPLLAVANEGWRAARNQDMFGFSVVPYFTCLAACVLFFVADTDVYGLEVDFMLAMVLIRITAIALKYAYMAPATLVAIHTLEDKGAAMRQLARTLLLAGGQLAAVDELVLEVHSAAQQTCEPDNLLRRRVFIAADRAQRANEWLRPPLLELDGVPETAMRVPAGGGSLTVEECALRLALDAAAESRRDESKALRALLLAAPMVQAAIPTLAVLAAGDDPFPTGSAAAVVAKLLTCLTVVMFTPMCIGFVKVAVMHFWRLQAMLTELRETAEVDRRVSRARGVLVTPPLIALGGAEGNLRAWLAMTFIARKMGQRFQRRLELVVSLVGALQGLLAVLFITLLWTDMFDPEDPEYLMLSFFVVFDLTVFGALTAQMVVYGNTANGFFADARRLLSGIMVSDCDCAKNPALFNALSAGAMQLELEDQNDPVTFLGFRIDSALGSSMVALVLTAVGSYVQSLVVSDD